MTAPKSEVVVPREPTEAMLRAAKECARRGGILAADYYRAMIAAAPQAQADAVDLREGVADVPRDEQGRTAYDIIRDANHTSAMMRAGIKDRSREPLLGPPNDMIVSRVILSERPEITAHDADLLAVKINDALAQPAPHSGGAWIEWSGGENPVPGQMVDVTWPDQTVSHSAPSDQWGWEHDGDAGNIIAYRVVAPHSGGEG